MKAISEVARRYAKALFEISQEARVVDEVSSELKALLKSINENTNVRDALYSPVITNQEKNILVNSILEDAKLRDETMNFIRLLADKDRLIILSEVNQALEAFLDESKDVKRGVVLSPEKLSEQERAEVEKTIADFTKNKVALDFKTESGLIGGIVAEVGSYTFDGSLKTQLKKLKEELKRS